MCSAANSNHSQSETALAPGQVWRRRGHEKTFTIVALRNPTVAAIRWDGDRGTALISTAQLRPNNPFFERLS